MRVRAALVGCGRWGTKLLAALQRHPAFEVTAVVDPDGAAQQRASRLAPEARISSSLDEALAGDLQAVLIATPSELHATQALRAIEAGADVFVEKPMALSTCDAERLCVAVRAHGCVGMVGHVLRFHPAVQRLIALVRGGFVGPAERVVGRRFTQSGSPSPLWTLGPHDLCTLHAFDPSPVVAVSARRRVPSSESLLHHAGSVVGAGFIPARQSRRPVPLRAVTPPPAAFVSLSETRTSEAVEAGVALELRLASGLQAALHVSTTAVTPARELWVLGRAGMLAVDELDEQQPLHCSPALAGHGDLDVAPADALVRELDHFAQCVASRATPLTGFDDARWIVETLERVGPVLERRAPVRAAAPLPPV